ncbi:pinin [Elysia marginata]|uniref:Pinin n=1 Tax=Elysia marginata TaxID=1093978 RepID=A0AAV4F5N1_9GAST|nr:pinin [Elysia marginata]
MAELRGVHVLQNEIEKSKDKLRGYNENIKKLTGRDVTRPGVRRFLSGDRDRMGDGDRDGFQNRATRGRGRLFGLARRGIMDDGGPPSKRRIVGGAFSRLGPAPMRRNEREDSPYEEELPHKLSVHSSVVATSREAKNRDEIMQEQTKDKEGMQRNRRMFGLLLGTLNRFKTESKTLETKDVRRKKIEEKLEEKAEKEKKKFKQETKLLMEEMHLEQSKISRLEQKMEMVQEHADREAELLKLKNFIVTKAKPRIFWKPVQMSTVAENKMKDSKKFVDDLLQEGKDRLDKEIVELMERESKREERIKMRLREDGLFGDEEEEKGEEVKMDEDKTEGSERVVVETKEVGESLTIRLGQKIKKENDDEDADDDNDDDDDDRVRDAETEKTRKPKRTVVIDSEPREASEVEEEGEVDDGERIEEDKSKSKEKESGDDMGVESLQNQEENITKRTDVSEEGEMNNSDAEEEIAPKQVNRQNSGSGGRKSPATEKEKEKSPVKEKERRKSGEKKESDADKDRSRHRDKKEEQTSGGREHHSERSSKKDRHRNNRDIVRDRSTERTVRNRSTEREKRKHREEDSRRDSVSDKRERSRRDSRSERRDHTKEKKRSKKNDSSSEDERPVRIKKEQESGNVGKESKKFRSARSEDDEDDDDDGKEKSKRADNAGKSAAVSGEDEERTSEQNSSMVDN